MSAPIAELNYRTAFISDVHLISINPANGHGLLSYLLKTPVHRFVSSNRKPIQYLADIQRGYTRRLQPTGHFMASS